MPFSSSPPVQIEETPELFQVPSVTPIVNDDVSIRLALASHLGRDVNSLTITISQNTGSHARGGVDNGYFLAAKVNDQWQIVANGQGALDCQIIAQYGFPASMVPECSGSSGPPSDDDALRVALAAHLGRDVNSLTITISQNTGVYARGGVDNGYFLAAKFNGQWQIVADGQGAIECKVVAQYGFPASMVPECSGPSGLISDEDALKAALGAHLGRNVNDLKITVSQNTGSHARGGVENGYFLAAKVNGQWQIVADGQGALDCQIIAQYNFPASMVPECSGSSGPSPSNADALKAAIAAYLGRNLNSLTITISQNTGTYARGEAENGYFLAAKVNGQCQIVAAGQGVIDCQIMNQYGFPASMVPECSGSSGPPPSDVDALKAAIAAYLGRDANSLTITISQNTGTYARGGAENGYFLAAKVNGQWKIVAAGQGVIDCQIITQYSFPESMVPECPLSNVLRFKRGGTYTFTKNVIKAGEKQTYTLNASAGQTIILGASSQNHDVYIGVRGVQGGQQLVSNSSQLVDWTGTLPQTQTYQITITTNNPDTYYFLNVEIPATVRFEDGAYAATVQGHIEIFEDTPAVVGIDNHVTYLINASAGQTMDVKIISPDIDVLSLGVYGQDDGQPYERYQVKNSGFHGVLPVTQGYYLEVFSFKKSTDFTLEITIL